MTTANISHERDKQIQQFIEQNMDMYRVPKMRGRFRATRQRYIDMSKGGDGGKMNPKHVDTIRSLHHDAWSDEDFNRLIEGLDIAVKAYHGDDDALEDIPQDIEGIIMECVKMLSTLNHNNAVDALNSIADKLQLFSPEDG